MQTQQKSRHWKRNQPETISVQCDLETPRHILETQQLAETNKNTRIRRSHQIQTPIWTRHCKLNKQYVEKTRHLSTQRPQTNPENRNNMGSEKNEAKKWPTKRKKYTRPPPASSTHGKTDTCSTTKHTRGGNTQKHIGKTNANHSPKFTQKTEGSTLHQSSEQAATWLQHKLPTHSLPSKR